jgi:hypothetical protein
MPLPHVEHVPSSQLGRASGSSATSSSLLSASLSAGSEALSEASADLATGAELPPHELVASIAPSAILVARCATRGRANVPNVLDVSERVLRRNKQELSKSTTA